MHPSHQSTPPARRTPDLIRSGRRGGRAAAPLIGAVLAAVATLPAGACLDDVPATEDAALDAPSDADQLAPDLSTTDGAPADATATCAGVPIGGASPSNHPCTVCGPGGAFVPCPFTCGSTGRCLAATQLALGESHSCALLDDGSVWCWGDREHGQLAGVVSDTPRHVPAQVADLPPADAIATHRHHTCALAGGDVWCWGRNRFRQAWPAGPSAPATTPRRAFANATAIGVGEETSCAVDGAGAVWCWGIALDGQDWTGEPVGHYHATPVPIEGLGPVRVVRVGTSAACAWERGGAVRCWGSGESGQLGDGAAVDDPIPVAVPLPSGMVLEQLAFGVDTVFALGDRGQSLLVWGDNAGGQATGDVASRSFPRPESLPWGVRGTMVEVAPGARHTCLRYASGAIICWGMQDAGNLGHDGVGVHPPAEVEGLRRTTGLAAGHRHSCVIEEAGWVACWGDNARGQAGRPPMETPSVLPPAIVGLSSP